MKVFDDKYTDELDDTFIKIREVASFITEQNNKNMQDALINGLFEIAQKYKVVVNEEKLLKWLKQAQQIENATKKQIQDLKAKCVIQEYEEELKAKNKKIEELEKKLCDIQDVLGHDFIDW